MMAVDVMRSYTGDDTWCHEDTDVARDTAGEMRNPDEGPLDSPAVEPEPPAPETTEAEQKWLAVDPEFRAELEAADNSDADRYAEYIVRKICHAERDLNKALILAADRYLELTGEIEAVIKANEQLQELLSEREKLEKRAAEISDFHKKRVDGLRAYYERPLRLYAEANTSEKVRGVKLLYGTLSLRKSPPKLVVDDTQALLEWLREYHKDLIVETAPANPVKAIATQYEWITRDTVADTGEITGTERILIESATKQVVDPSAYPAGIHIEQEETFKIATEESKR